jgi:hypothetical protein
MCISKISGGGGGVYLGKEFHGGERELRWPDSEIAGGGSGNGERMGEGRKKGGEEERRLDRVVIHRRAPPYLAPNCDPRAPVSVAPSCSSWHKSATVTIGHQLWWRPAM